MPRVRKPEEQRKIGLPEGLQITQDEDRDSENQRTRKIEMKKNLNRLRKWTGEQSNGTCATHYKEEKTTTISKDNRVSQPRQWHILNISLYS
jgi:hypothetical protein